MNWHTVRIYQGIYLGTNSTSTIHSHEQDSNANSQPTKNRKSVQFSKIVRVRHIPPNIAYESEKNKMFWTRLELEYFKLQSNDEILEFAGLRNCTNKDAQFELYQPDSSFSCVSICINELT